MFMGVFDRFRIAGRIFRPPFLASPRRAGRGAAARRDLRPKLDAMYRPTLTAVLLLGENTGTALRGGLLAFVYGLGIGIPFLIMAFAFQRGVTSSASPGDTPD